MFTDLSLKISAIPTHLITGFLGVGKTTAIIKLLSSKPKHEKWAVLVNEFGEVGIDAAIISKKSCSSNQNASTDIYIREVPGGCMCCASGVPMQVALNQLISKAKPDRLLIEPTGLGHPKEIIDVLTGPNYQTVISLKTTLCLIDARNLNDERYTTHPSFIQQLKVADTIIAAKADQYVVEDEQNLSDFLVSHQLTNKPLYLMHHGVIDPLWLEGSASASKNYISSQTVTASKITKGLTRIGLSKEQQNNSNENEKQNFLQKQLIQNKVIELTNKGEGFFSKGWIFSDEHTFNFEKLITMLKKLKVRRAKGIIITELGSYTFNKANTEFTYKKIAASTDSRIELIDTDNYVLNKLDKEHWLKFNI
jgi:G3E family GTPase